MWWLEVFNIDCCIAFIMPSLVFPSLSTPPIYCCFFFVYHVTRGIINNLQPRILLWKKSILVKPKEIIRNGYNMMPLKRVRKFGILINAEQKTTGEIKQMMKINPLSYFPLTATCAKTKMFLNNVESKLKQQKRQRVLRYCDTLKRRQLITEKGMDLSRMSPVINFPLSSITVMIRLRFLHVVSLILKKINIYSIFPHRKRTGKP